MKLIDAKDLRDKKMLNTISKTKPGYYKWWAPKESVVKLLDSKYLNNQFMKTVFQHLTVKSISNKEYYLIYVGIAVKDSIRNRLNWHINQHHTESSVYSSFLSTLRKSISSLVANNQCNEALTNDFIDTLIVEYEEIDALMKSNNAKNIIEKYELNEMRNNVLPLNIRDNKNEIIKGFLKELKALRKRTKYKK